MTAETRALTVMIPKPVNGTCSTNCPLRRDGEESSWTDCAAGLSAEGATTYKVQQPGPNCPWGKPAGGKEKSDAG